MLSARQSEKTVVDLLTKSINVVDALEEAKTGGWKEIILLGFTYDQSDLTTFEAICHSSSKRTITHNDKTYTLESIANKTHMTYFATKDGNCCVTEAEFVITHSDSSTPKKLGVTLFVFASELNRLRLREDEIRIAKLLENLYWRHKAHSIPVYFIGNARPHYFNIPLIFSSRDEGFSSSLVAHAVESSTQRIRRRFSECKDMNLMVRKSRSETMLDAMPEKVEQPKDSNHVLQVNKRLHQFSRVPAMSAPCLSNEVEAKEQKPKKSSFCVIL